MKHELAYELDLPYYQPKTTCCQADIIAKIENNIFTIAYQRVLPKTYALIYKIAIHSDIPIPIQPKNNHLCNGCKKIIAKNIIDLRTYAKLPNLIQENPKHATN